MTRVDPLHDIGKGELWETESIVGLELQHPPLVLRQGVYEAVQSTGSRVCVNPCEEGNGDIWADDIATLFSE